MIELLPMLEALRGTIIRGADFLVRHEDLRFQPAITMRPHHFRDPLVQRALVAAADPRALAEFKALVYLTALGKPFRQTSVDPDYLRDLLNQGSSEERQKLVDGWEDYFRQLGGLTNESFVHLDLQPDGLCNGCVIGNHCRATGYSTGDIYTTVNDMESIENKSLVHLRRKLKEHGFRRGVDFIDKSTTHVLRDFGGQLLNAPVETLPSNTIRIKSLVVRTGALRVVAEAELASRDSMFL